MPRTRRLLVAATFVVCACDGNEIIDTGGFNETLIDTEIRHAQSFAVADMDGDGNNDIVAALSLTDGVHIYLHPGDLSLPWEIIPISGLATIVAIATAVNDFDGDGDLDVAAAGQFVRTGGFQSPGEVAWYENPGDPRGVWRRHRIYRPIFDDEEFVWIGGIFGLRTIGQGDLDGDGDADLVVGAQDVVIVNGENEGGGLYWFQNQGPEEPGRFRGPATIDRVQINDLRIADWDQDGREDVLTTGGLEQGQISWYRNTAASDSPRFVRRQLLANERESFGLAIGNMDNQGPDELIVTEAQTASTTAIRQIDLPSDIVRDRFPIQTLVSDLRGGGTGSSARVCIADFDQDDRLDIVSGTAFGSLYLHTRGPGGFWQTRTVRTGYLGLSYLGHDDVNADGREDILTTTVDFGFRDRVAWWRSLEEAP